MEGTPWLFKPTGAFKAEVKLTLRSDISYRNTADVEIDLVLGNAEDVRNILEHRVVVVDVRDGHAQRRCSWL